MFKCEFGIIPLALHNLFEKNIVLFIHITLDTGTNFDMLWQSMRTEIKILGLSLYMSRTMFVTILSLMCPFYR